MEYAYLRQSLDAEGDRDAVTRQRTALEKLDGPAVDEWFTDNDMSAKKDKPRPDFERLLTVLRAGDRVRMVRVDRLVRRPIDLERLIEKAERGVTVRTLSGTIRLDTAEGRVHARVLVAFGAMESELNSERRRLADAQRAERGLPIWSRPGARVFGYRREGDSIVFEEAEAAALLKAKDDFCAGKGLTRICAELTAAGFHTTSKRHRGPRAGEWAAWEYSTLRKHLTNPRYAGLCVYRGQRYPAAWPALWDEAELVRIETLMQAVGRRQAYSSRARQLLSTIMVCGVCFEPTSAIATRDLYVCNPSRHVGRRIGVCDWFVEAQLLGRLARTGHPQTDHVDSEETRVRAAQIEELTARRDALARMVARGLMSIEAVEAEAEKLTVRLAALEAMPAATRAGSIFGRFARGARSWEDLELPQRRALLRAEVSRLVLEPVGAGRHMRRQDPGVSIVWIDGTLAAPLPLEAV